VAISAPYATGTVSSVSGTTFTASASTFVAGDVGRLIILTDGSGKLQHRKIVSYTSGTVVEVDHAWNATPWLRTVSDVEPSNGDAFVVSYLQDDVAFTGEVGVSVSGEQIDISAIELTGGAYVHITNAQVDLDSNGVEIGAGAGMVFGWYHYIQGEDAQAVGRCHIIDRTTGDTGQSLMSRGAKGADAGMLDLYGCHVQTVNSPFWTMYDGGDSSDTQCRWVYTSFQGDFGSRVDGDRSILVIESADSTSTAGASNPRSAVSRTEFSSFSCDQSVYVWLDTNDGGPNGRAVLNRLSGINSRVIRCSLFNAGADPTGVYEVIAKKSEIDAAPAFIESTSSGTNTNNHKFRYGNIIKPSFFDATATKITDDIKTVLKDTNGTITNTETVTTGDYTEHFDRHTDIITPTGATTLNLGDGTQYAPYTLTSFSFGKRLFNQSISLEDTFDAPLTLLDEDLLTETVKTTIDGYTQIDTPQKFFDRAYSELYDSITNEEDYTVTRNGEIIEAGSYDVDIDGTIGGDAFVLSGNKITIKATTYTGLINTTGTITTLNGAVYDNGIIEVTEGATYIEDAAIKFVVDTDSVNDFTLDGFTPTKIEAIGTGTTTVTGINNAKLVGTTITEEVVDQLIAGDGLNPSASFVYNSSGDGTLTISATETSLLGLRGHEAVDYEDIGGKLAYTFKDKTRLVIANGGMLTIDSTVEQLVCGTTVGVNNHSILVQNGGTLILGRETIVGGFSSFSNGPVIVFNNTSTENQFTWNELWANLKVENGGRLDWYGGTIFSSGALGFMSSAQLNTYSGNAEFVSVTNPGNPTPYAAFRLLSTVAVINGLTLKGGSMTPLDNPASFSGYNPVQMFEAISVSNSTEDNTFITFYGLLAGQGNDYDIRIKERKWIRLVNTNNGSDLNFEYHGTGDELGIIEVRKEVTLDILDTGENPIDGVKVKGTDVNHGSRLGAGVVGTNPDYVADRVYSGTSSGGQVSFTGDTGSILVAVLYLNNAKYSDYRGLTNTNADTFAFNLYKYGKLITTQNVVLKGTGALVQKAYMLDDANTTAPLKATVDAYTEINTAQQFYDRACAFLDDNHDGEQETIVSRNGDVIEAGSLNVIIDGATVTAPNAFEFDGSTITIHASTFTGGINTTGSITVRNGALLNGGTF